MSNSKNLLIMIHKFKARMIDNGKVVNTASIEIEDKSHKKAAYKAYKKAQEGINPYSGVWVEIKDG